MKKFLLLLLTSVPLLVVAKSTAYIEFNDQVILPYTLEELHLPDRITLTSVLTLHNGSPSLDASIHWGLKNITV